MKKEKSSFLSFYLKGVAIGFAAIIPGISGGTIAYILNIYDALIFAINDIRKHFKQSLTILFPVGLGVLSAIVALTFPIGIAFEFAPLPTVSLFAGFILGGLPLLAKKAQFKKDLKSTFLFSFPLLLAMSLGLFSVIGQLDASQIVENPDVAPKFVLLFIGILSVSAFIVPGISGSMLLLALGFYEPILQSLEGIIASAPFVWEASNDFLNFIFLGVGMAIGFALISALMGYLLKRYPLAVYLAVFGFVVGSIFSIYVNYEIIVAYEGVTFLTILLSGLSLGGGTYLSYRFNQRYAS